jgi:hypothetical protein
MTMNITEKYNISAFKCLFNHELDSVNFRVDLGHRHTPLAVKILSRKRASIIAYNDTVWVKHRHNLEHKVVSKITGTFIITYEKI